MKEEKKKRLRIERSNKEETVIRKEREEDWEKRNDWLEV